MRIIKFRAKKRECWENFKFARRHLNTDKKIFDFIFDRAYALGKEKETITQKEIEKASLKYILNRQQAKHDAKREEASLSDFDNTLKVWDAFDMAQAYEDGANFALGKQEKDADTVISGWVAINEAYNECYLHTNKPTPEIRPIADTGDYDSHWGSEGQTYLLDADLFPDMDSDSEPQECEIIIKRKKK